MQYRHPLAVETGFSPRTHCGLELLVIILSNHSFTVASRTYLIVWINSLALACWARHPSRLLLQLVGRSLPTIARKTDLGIHRDLLVTYDECTYAFMH